MVDKRLKHLDKWAKRLEKRQKQLMLKINGLNAEFESFFEEYNKVCPELDEIETKHANMLLDDLKNTFELDL